MVAKHRETGGWADLSHKKILLTPDQGHHSPNDPLIDADSIVAIVQQVASGLDGAA